MKLETESLMQLDASLTAQPSVAAGWRRALPLVLGAIVAILVLYWRTAESIVDIWWRSETFAHGFAIVPISAWLIWSKRREIARLVPSFDYLGLILLAGAGLAWLVADAAQVQVIRQYALVAMIPAAVIAVTGRNVALALAFPLGFLFLGVPIGEALLQPLMDWTADITEVALRLTGFPVYRDGNFLTIPSGQWSIVEGCSGLRYLIASVTVGALFAYLNYRTLWKRMLFLVASVIVPIIANWLRAYMIVMIGHLSEMKLAVGVDHLIYGWVFFGMVMLLLFWVGSFWREDMPQMPRDVSHEKDAVSLASAQTSSGSLAMAAIAAVAVSGPWPFYAAHLDRSDGGRVPPRLEIPAGMGGWTLESTPITDWRPRYEGASASFFQTYRKGDRTVVLYLGYYPQQREDAKLVTSTNIMVKLKHPVWSKVGESRRTEDLGKGPQDVRQTLLRENTERQRLLVWDWFRISGRDLTNPYAAKLLLLRDRLLDRGDEGSAIIVGTPYEDTQDAAVETLREFMREMAPSIDAALMHVAADADAKGHRAQ